MVVRLRNTETVGNNTTGATLFEGNGTLYSVMDINYGVTYDRDRDENLHSILDTMCVLTEIVGSLHDAGYLHLDIKPVNFLVSHKPNTNVWLFDVDSLTSIRELSEGLVKHTPYSNGWAAPEQLLGKVNRLCPATDLFAIGSILFEKVMGRPVAHEDMSAFAEWEFESKLFEKVNPRVKRCLKEIFRKTLAASPKRRYQRAEELTEAFKVALGFVEQPYIQSNCPLELADIIGRNEEIDRIHQVFSEGKRTVFLHGFGGVGKSTLSVAYGNRYAEEYSCILFLEYQDSLEKLFEEIEIQRFDGDKNEKKKMLRRILDKDTLVIIDNFDIAVDEDEYLADVLKMNACFLFTTRTDFSSVFAGMVAQIEVNPLPEKQQEELFQRESKQYIADSDEREVLRKILKKIEGHTISIVWYAKQLYASGCSLDELYSQICNGFAEWELEEKIRYTKDGRAIKTTVPNAMHVLFRIAQWTEPMKKALRNLYLLDKVIKVDKEQYKRFICSDIKESKVYDKSDECWYYSFELIPRKRAGVEVLNDLEELGLIGYKGSNGAVYAYKLHTLMQELVLWELMPDEENCPEFFGYIRSLIQACMFPYERDEADEAKYEIDNAFLSCYFANADYRIAANAEYVIQFMEGVGISRDQFRRIYKKLMSEVSRQRFGCQDEFHIRLINFKSCLKVYESFFVGAGRERWEQEREEELLDSYRSLRMEMKRLSVLEQEKLEQHIYRAIVEAMANRFIHGLPKEIIKVVPDEIMAQQLFDIDTKKKYKIPLTSEEAEEERRKKEELENDPDYQEFIEDGEWRKEWREEFWDSEDKVQFVKEMMADQDFRILSVDLLGGFMRDMFYNIYRFLCYDKEYYEKIGWNVICEILEIEKQCLIERYGNRLFYFHEENVANRMIAYAIQGKCEQFNECLEEINEGIVQEIAQAKAWDWQWLCGANRSGGLRLIRHVFEGLRSTENAHFILPYIVDVAEKLEAYARRQPDFEERYLYSLYNLVKECAEEASLAYRGNRDEKEKIWEIEWAYTDKIEAITGADYNLQWNYENSDE